MCVCMRVCISMDELSLVEEHLFSNDQQQNRKKKTINESITP